MRRSVLRRVGVLVLAAVLCAPGLNRASHGDPKDTEPLDAHVRWTWGATASEFPSFTDVWSTPTVARLLDTNGDGVVDEDDEPSIIFISGRSIDANTGLGTTCAATGTFPSACHTGVLRVLDGRTGEEQFSLDRPSPFSAGFAGISLAVG